MPLLPTTQGLAEAVLRSCGAPTARFASLTTFLAKTANGGGSGGGGGNGVRSASGVANNTTARSSSPSDRSHHESDDFAEEEENFPPTSRCVAFTALSLRVKTAQVAFSPRRRWQEGAERVQVGFLGGGRGAE